MEKLKREEEGVRVETQNEMEKENGRKQTLISVKSNQKEGCSNSNRNLNPTNPTTTNPIEIKVVQPSTKIAHPPPTTTINVAPKASNRPSK